MMKSPFVKS
ncbi:hypothetical protein LINPERHAP1_LOCUS23229 [Linum perenne]